MQVAVKIPVDQKFLDSPVLLGYTEAMQTMFLE